MANLIITSRRAATVLREPDIQKMLVDGLVPNESQDLCSVLGLVAEAPRLTLSHVNFNLPNNQSVFLNFAPFLAA